MSDFYFPNTPDYTDPHKYDYLNEEAELTALADRLMIGWNTPLFVSIHDIRIDSSWRAVTVTVTDTTRPWNRQTVSRTVSTIQDFSDYELNLIGAFEPIV